MQNIYKDAKPTVIIKSVLDVLHEPGEVFEVRIPKNKAGTLSGYFDDPGKAAIFVAKENGKNQAIYATVNPVKPALLARMENRISLSQVTTTDSEIEKRRWFLLDFDPKRPTGISSTDGELELARNKATEVQDWLSSIGWPEPLRACSGNGWHLMYRIDEPNTDEVRIDIEFATKMLASIFTDHRVDIDVSVFNASRVWKIYGTLSMKGSSTEERPHRISFIESVPKTWVCVTRAQIENVARPLRDAKSDEFKDMTGEYIADMQKWLMDRGQTVVSGPRPLFGSEGQKWVISRCPFDHNHVNPIVGLVNHRPIYRCLHNSCSGYKWKEFREKIDPSYKDPDTIRARIKEWCEGEEEVADPELLQSACATGKKLEGILKSLRKEVPRARLLLIEEQLKLEKRRFIRDTIGENNEKGNIVGLINRTRALQAEGIVPMYWIADYDHRIRVGPVGDIECPKASEADEVGLMIKFHSLGDSWVKQTHARQVLLHLAEEYRVNPLKVMLKAKRWDGRERLSTWLSQYLGTLDNEYTRAIGRKWMISAVARAMEPGCQADHMLILEGPQGIGKSQAARILGGQFYSEYSGSLKMANKKDLVAIILGKMIVEMSELATLKRADMESLKATLTTCVDDERLSYERDAKSYPRTCVFLGTTNAVKKSYIVDTTGARRFWPTVVGEVRPPMNGLLRQDIDQLWAEAVEAYESGEDWYSVPQESVKEEQAQRQLTTEEADPWYTRMRQALTDPDQYGVAFHVVDEYIKGQKTDGFMVRLAPVDIVLASVIGVDISRQSGMDVLRIRNILQEIGFKKVRPSRKWMDATWAYDLTRGAAPHLWPAIEGASKSSKFPAPAKTK